MPLEDFFTLTEMKDGLATLARVEELVGVMKKKENLIKHAGDAARQWSTVANVLAATENKECLNYFLKLDGLPFLDEWLQEAQSCSLDAGESFSEESINALLGALEKLPTDNELLTASGIQLTVKNLIDHKSFQVQERARALFGSWNQVTDEYAKDKEEGGPCLDDLKASPDIKGSPEEGSPNGSVEDRSSVGEVSSKDWKTTKSIDASEVRPVDDVEVPESGQAIPKAETNRTPGDASSARSSSSPSMSEKTSSESKDLYPGLEDGKGMHAVVSESKDMTASVKEVQVNLQAKEGSPSYVDKEEICNATQSCKFEESISLPTAPADCEKSMTEASKLKQIVDLKGEVKDNETRFEASQGPSSNGCSSEIRYSPANSLNRKEVSRTDDDIKELASESDSEGSDGENYMSHSDISTPILDTRGPNEMDQRNTDMEIDYGADDALEVARWVAKEAEREVVDYRGPYCSSSLEKNSEGDIAGTDSPDSAGVKQDEPMVERINEVSPKPSVEEDDTSGYSPEAKRLKISNDVDKEPEKSKDEIELTPNTLAQEVAVESQRSRCEFDLNEDVCTEENDCLLLPITPQRCTLSTPIAVTASKGVPGLPSTPLHFSGELGWRGSASTSAFRPPSPRRTPDGDKISLVDASSSGSKQRQSVLKIDLNVTSDEIEAVADLAPSVKLARVPSSLPSRESSIEVSSRRAERPNLDLNQLGDSDDACPFPSTDWNMDGRFQNGHHSQSPASSSSSRRPPLRNFDLNDNLFITEARVSHEYRQNPSKAPLQEVKNYASFKLDDPVVSIMGSRVDINRNDFFNRTPNGQSTEAAFGANLVRPSCVSGAQPSFTYTPLSSSAFGYNDLTVGQNMSFPLHMYGPNSSVPYMVDSRGASVIPQILSSSSTVSAPSFSRPPFFMGIPGASTDPTGIGFAHSGLDLNSGMAAVDGERKEGSSLRQFFSHAHGGGSLDEHMRSALHPPGTGTGMMLKQKEPEHGWELNVASYKQEASWR